MKKRFLTVLLAGAMISAALLAGCEKDNPVDVSSNDTSSVVQSQSDESTVDVSSEDTSSVVESQSDESAVESEEPEEEGTKLSTITKNTYYNKTYGFTMTFPDNWKNNMYIIESDEFTGPAISFFEKSNYDVDESGFMFRIWTSKAEIESGNNTRNMGSIVDSDGNRIFIACNTPSDVQCDITSETLSSNYSNVSVNREDVIKSVVFDADREYNPPVDENGIILSTAE